MSKCNFSKDTKLALLKGYLHYKTIISVSSGTHVKYFFLFPRKVTFSRYSSLCIFSHPMI